MKANLFLLLSISCTDPKDTGTDQLETDTADTDDTDISSDCETNIDSDVPAFYR